MVIKKTNRQQETLDNFFLHNTNNQKIESNMAATVKQKQSITSKQDQNASNANTYSNDYQVRKFFQIKGKLLSSKPSM